MIPQNIIEEHPHDVPAPSVSNIVIVPKSDGDIRITLDARNVNKGIIASNLPIPKQEDIQAKMAGSNLFSKLDLKSAFWQLELHPESRQMTTFHANNKLYRYKRLSMGLKPAQTELDATLQPLFANIERVHLTHNDLIIAARSLGEHNKLLEKVMKIISDSGIFGANETKFWGLIVNAEGVHPDPEKFDALKYMSLPENKSELLSFMCMMQSNSDFIPNFSKLAAPLQEITISRSHFKWTKEHQDCFEQLKSSFSKEALLHYFDLNKNTFLLVDAHRSGLGAILVQGNTMNDARPVAVASRTTNDAEKRYPQIDLDAMSADFALRRFMHYLAGSPKQIMVVTDHKPLQYI